MTSPSAASGAPPRTSTDPVLLAPELALRADGSVVQGPILIEDGRVAALGRDAEQRAATAARAPRPLALPGRMLLPGFVDVHSHAFQRALRGRVETRSLERSGAVRTATEAVAKTLVLPWTDVASG